MESQRGSFQENSKLRIDFSWHKFKAVISPESKDPSIPIYTVSYKVTSPQLVFKTGDKTIGTGHLKGISIDASCTLHNTPIEIVAQKRFKISYTHQSYAFSPNPDSPVTMSWTSTVDLKHLDFICLDEKQNPVAKVSTNLWALKRIGYVEFLGEESERKREEIIVVGLTLFYEMYLRLNNPGNLLGSVFSKPGAKMVGDKGVELEEGSGKVKRL